MKRDRLIQERKKRNKSHGQVAEDIGISKVYVRMIEAGTVKPGRDKMIKFSEYYGLGLKTLFPDLFQLESDKKFINPGA